MTDSNNPPQNQFRNQLLNQPHNHPQTITPSLQNSLKTLANLMQEKLAYSLQRKSQKMAKKLRKTKQNYNNYLKAHKMMPEYLYSVWKFGEIVSRLFRKQINGRFRKIKEWGQGGDEGRPTGREREKRRDGVGVGLGIEFKQPLVVMVWHLFQNKKQLNWAFSNLKSKAKSSLAQEIGSKYRNKTTKQANIEQIRIFESNRNKSMKHDLTIQDRSFADSLIEEDLSNFVDMTLTEKKINLKQELMNKIKQLEHQFHRTIKKYSEIRFNLENQILETNQGDFSRAQNLWGSQVKWQISQDSKERSTHECCIQLSRDQSLKIEDKETIADLLQRHQELNDEADHVRASIDLMLYVAVSDANINPKIIQILNQVKKLLMPNPLGVARQ